MDRLSGDTCNYVKNTKCQLLVIELLLRTRQCAKHFAHNTTCKLHNNLPEVVIPILSTRKLRHSEVESYMVRSILYFRQSQVLTQASRGLQSAETKEAAARLGCKGYLISLAAILLIRSWVQCGLITLHLIFIRGI